MLKTSANRCFRFVVIVVLLAVGGASAQTIAYRQTNLSSDVDAPGFANHLNPTLRNPWGIAFVPGQAFFMANTINGRVIALDATGSSTQPGGFVVPNPAGDGPGTPTGIVADPQSFFRSTGSQPFLTAMITATEDGRIYFWGVNADGSIPTAATLVVDHSQAGAVYTGLAILTPLCCAPVLAVANFHSGRVETYGTDFAPLGTFLDPSLPDGYAPYGMQVIGDQLFVASAVQDTAKHGPLLGAGNGIVSVFDFEGRFLRRFAMSGSLNAPWGITQASANFGPFSNDILIGNVGDGIINAFDPITGNFAGQIKDGDGNAVVNSGLHGLTFRPDGFGDPNTLYFTAGINNGQGGLFGAINIGLVSTAKVSASSTPANTPVAISVTVFAGPGNPGTPTGLVSLRDGGRSLSDASLVNGVALFDQVLTGAGTHVIEARYRGDATFLPSTSQTEVEVTDLSTMLTLTAPANAALGSPMTLTATISSAGGIPTGQIVFHDGNTDLGIAPLNDAGVAILRINTLAAGTHSLTASYASDGKFGDSTSAPVTVTIASRDFSLDVAPPTATVTAGQSALFSISVTPAGGFTDPITFSCPLMAGITCNFAPPTVTPAGGVATTMLTVTTSANLLALGQTFGMAGPGLLLAGLGLIGTLLSPKKRVPVPRAVLRGAFTVIALALTLVSCGGQAANRQTNRTTASIVVTAQSGAISHTTTISVTVQ